MNISHDVVERAQAAVQDEVESRVPLLGDDRAIEVGQVAAVLGRVRLIAPGFARPLSPAGARLALEIVHATSAGRDDIGANVTPTADVEQALVLALGRLAVLLSRVGGHGPMFVAGKAFAGLEVACVAAFVTIQLALVVIFVFAGTAVV